MDRKHADLIKGLSDKQILYHLYFTQFLLLIVSCIMGSFLFSKPADFFSLFRWGEPELLTIGVTTGVAVAAVDLLMMRLLPPRFYDDGGLNEKLFQNRTMIEIAFISAIVALSEEILFRGVIQTAFGLVPSSIIFALVHYRYLYNWFLFVNIMVLSFLIGYIYKETGNLSVTITMHFMIDFLLGFIISIKKKG
ncbi:CPBP family intramembrane glutamic endopeptidase [Bacillus massilinigeriensis]|uniref:CPBP family intramembrane glutamic endopeptidase n=1 Tax=Bacillus mediterraneensis TaxID=1805474 RepID=UPI0008F9014D|nr:CPBP family intramembrane glutamic endopeptidase [Bacillus mediterraneensis]